MRLRRYLFVCALVLVMPLIELNRATAQEVEKADANRSVEIIGTSNKLTDTESKKEIAPVPTPLPLVRKDVVYISAYKDVYHILSAQNPCSSFFGGASKAVEVLNGLFRELETSRLPSSKIGLSMSGQTRNVRNAQTGTSYRLFEKAVINTSGPFYQKERNASGLSIPNIGSYSPNTREARAAILLHEIGHLIQGADGRWLLPNDGSSETQSRQNTATIETRCSEQLKELGGSKAEQNASVSEKADEPQGSQQPK